MEYKNAWGKHLGRDIRNLCRFCIDGTGDAADIVCADFWHLGENGMPDFSEHDGRSIIITRTTKGTKTVEDSIHTGHITIEEDFTERIDSEFQLYQPNHYKRKGTMGSMIRALKLCGKQAPRYSGSYLKKYGEHIDSKVKMKFFLGTVKRIIKGKI